MRPVQIDERLQTVAAFVPAGARAAEIGCDHAYLICSLAESGKIAHGLACDLNAGPLAQARREVETHKLGDKVECRLGDGLSCVGQDEVDTVIIAGMGGETIAAILAACAWENKSDKLFVLQPMTRAPLLRRWLYHNGYVIETESACIAAGHPYTVMRVRYAGKCIEIGEYELYAYIGDLGQRPCRAAREYIRRAAVSLVRRENGLLGVNPKVAQQLRVLSNKMLAMTEGW